MSNDSKQDPLCDYGSPPDMCPESATWTIPPGTFGFPGELHGCDKHVWVMADTRSPYYYPRPYAELPLEEWNKRNETLPACVRRYRGEKV